MPKNEGRLKMFHSRGKFWERLLFHACAVVKTPLLSTFSVWHHGKRCYQDGLGQSAGDDRSTGMHEGHHGSKRGHKRLESSNFNGLCIDAQVRMPGKEYLPQDVVAYGRILRGACRHPYMSMDEAMFKKRAV